MSDVNGEPVPDVEVVIPDLFRTVFTNEQGRFRIDDIVPGTRIVMLRKLGYAVKTDSIAFESNETVVRNQLLSRVAMLDTIAVTDRGMLDFDEHRRLGLGHFLTRAEIDKLQGAPISGVMRQIPGVGILAGRTGAAWIMNAHASQAITIMPDANNPNVWCPESAEVGMFGMRCGCYAAVYLDRILMNPPEARYDNNRRLIGRPNRPFDVNSIPSATIEAVEWYTGKGQLPLRYWGFNSECGVLVMHTRRRD